MHRCYSYFVNKRPLWVYIVGVLVALGIVNYVSYLTGGAAKLHTSSLVSYGFILGLIAMYIAVHLYRWR